MAEALHQRVESYLVDFFKEPNNGVKFGPIVASENDADGTQDAKRECVRNTSAARLWARRALPVGVLSSNTTLAGNGVYVKEWECGTIHHITHKETGYVFWDPPILGGVPNVEGYTAVIPNTVIGENFVIDLRGLQQVVLRTN
ncbi:1016_t:CDS:2 [Diversispora eburnea]|uniref:1016_t:CDS:1 n=1 Tax=Diversispora eburnea TaxID=1213867 RepID=A0A9N9AYX0_9GLOM|nr:1016_t:CDS:2 [Diversispora eburnea]